MVSIWNTFHEFSNDSMWIVLFCFHMTSYRTGKCVFNGIESNVSLKQSLKMILRATCLIENCFSYTMPEMKYDTYGKTIKSVRKYYQLSQEQFIEKTGLGRSQLYYLESGRRIPRIDTVETICQALEIPISHFFLIAEQLEKQDSEID